MSDQIITQDGYNKLKNELEEKIGVKRPDIAKKIETAKELGDLSENAEYHQAKDDQAFNEGRISEIKAILKKVTIVDNKNGSKNEIGMGSVVIGKINNLEKEFIIVSFNEADPSSGKISNESPLGLALQGRKRGDKIKVKTPKGEIEFEILKIK